MVGVLRVAAVGHDSFHRFVFFEYKCLRWTSSRICMTFIVLILTSLAPQYSPGIEPGIYSLGMYSHWNNKQGSGICWQRLPSRPVPHVTLLTVTATDTIEFSSDMSTFKLQWLPLRIEIGSYHSMYGCRSVFGYLFCIHEMTVFPMLRRCFSAYRKPIDT